MTLTELDDLLILLFGLVVWVGIWASISSGSLPSTDRTSAECVELFGHAPGKNGVESLRSGRCQRCGAADNMTVRERKTGRGTREEGLQRDGASADPVSRFDAALC